MFWSTSEECEWEEDQHCVVFVLYKRPCWPRLTPCLVCCGQVCKFKLCKLQLSSYSPTILVWKSLANKLIWPSSLVFEDGNALGKKVSHGSSLCIQPEESILRSRWIGSLRGVEDSIWHDHQPLPLLGTQSGFISHWQGSRLSIRMHI